MSAHLQRRHSSCICKSVKTLSTSEKWPVLFIGETIYLNIISIYIYIIDVVSMYMYIIDVGIYRCIIYVMYYFCWIEDCIHE